MSRYVHITSLMFFFFLELVTCQLSSTQNSTMNRLYELLYNSSSVTSFPWNPTNNPNPCSWNGVSCSPPNNSSITHLSLSSFSLSNSDSLPLICQIDTLQSLDLSNNHFTSIPDGFISGCGEIVGLKVLNFSRNRLVGSLPDFRGFDSLEVLDFSFNSLSGAIDLQFQGLNGLKSLNLSSNTFNGSIPINLGRSMALEELQLSRNSFQGNIPEGIANYGNLTLIDLGANNYLSGSIPERFGELSKLQLLILSLNQLSGEIPNSLSRITTLSRFAANQNRFTGVIPLGITTYLRNLDLSYNSLNGSIPLDLLSGPNLQAVDLSFNSLEGSIPTDLSANLIRLRLGSNKLNGRIPSSSLGVLQNLTYLEVDNNELSGTIPPELSSCINLTLLDLSHNNLTGLIPVELGNITNLHVLNLQQNNLVGEIPVQITQLQNLVRLNISWNSLHGSIPSSISSLHRLQNLVLEGNYLSGSIPNSIGSLDSLLELKLGSNYLSGVVVALPLNLQIVLNLSRNNFSGPIPNSLSKLRGLEVLDLSDNRFSGTIPDFLTAMHSLTQLILSNNQLSGVFPKFESYVNVISEGNDYLIYPPPPPPPSRTVRKKSSVSVGIIVAAAAAVITVGIVALIALLVSRRMYRVNVEHLHMEDHSPPPPHVINGSLLTGNAIHRSNIDFTKAMEAVVQSSNIVLQTRFTTYYKAIMPSGLSYFVKKINWSDKIFQLGSHDRFGEELQLLGKLNNSNVMTPLAYVLTVDSAYLLYEFAEKGTLFDVLHGSLGDVLDWTSRYSIAIGVAQALAFLHGSTSSPILLLDLSSKIILLKSLKEPQVGDVELCKVIDPSKNTGSISTIAGSVGYIPPEYAYTMRVTKAGNVYSFGVILLELLTGKAAVSEGIELAKWALSKSAQQDKWNSILDFSMSRKSPAIRGQMLAVLRVALACVSVSPDARPNMKSVLRMLLKAQ